MIRGVRKGGCGSHVHGVRGGHVRGTNHGWVCVQGRAGGGALRRGGKHWRAGCCDCNGGGRGGVLPLRTRWWNVFACVVFLYLEEVLLGVGAYLNDVFRLDVEFYLLPVAAVLFEGVQEGLVLFRGPVLAVLGDDVRLSWFLCRNGIGGEGGSCRWGSGSGVGMKMWGERDGVLRMSEMRERWGGHRREGRGLHWMRWEGGRCDWGMKWWSGLKMWSGRVVCHDGAMGRRLG